MIHTRQQSFMSSTQTFGNSVPHHTAENFVKICSYPCRHLYGKVLSDTLLSAWFMAMATSNDNECLWQYISLFTMVWVYLQRKISFRAERHNTIQANMSATLSSPINVYNTTCTSSATVNTFLSSIIHRHHCTIFHISTHTSTVCLKFC